MVSRSGPGSAYYEMEALLAPTSLAVTPLAPREILSDSIVVTLLHRGAVSQAA